MKAAIAKTQYALRASDLELVLALARAGTLAGASERLAVDTSTVFRSLRRLERGLGVVLFVRSRLGYLPNEAAQQIVAHAEQAETALELARSAISTPSGQVSGTVRISTTDTILHGLVLPALASLHASHPLIEFELHSGNEAVNLTRRDADIAVRATKKPPAHLVGRQLGIVRAAIFAAPGMKPGRGRTIRPEDWAWIAPDDALPDHPSVLWRKRHFPKVRPRYRVTSILSVAELVGLGMGVGILPLFLAAPRADLRQMSPPLDECETGLWLLAHPESRHLRRVSIVYAHLTHAIAGNDAQSLHGSA